MKTINTLQQVTYLDGNRGFVAKNDDSSSQSFFDEDGQELYSNPGPFVVIRELGQYDAGDADGFWALVAQA